MGCSNLDPSEKIINNEKNKEYISDYILPEGLAKRCELSDYYKISGQIIGEG